MRKLLRLGILWVLCFPLAEGCATAEDVGNASFDGSSTDTTIVEEVGGETTPAPDSGKADAVTETGEETAVDSGTTSDSTMPDTDPVDTGTADSAPVDTGPVDTGPDTGPVDTGTPDGAMCGPTDKYGPKCKTNLDCAAITGCGYVCCAFDPFLMTNLGCGRTSFGTSCLP